MHEVETWMPGEIIMIVANTGYGKSYFVKNTLRNHFQEKGQKCLYLLSRLRTKEQFEAELPNDETIQFMTYQTIEARKADPFASFGKWDVVIADECHYFLDDSDFNSRTDISLDWILEQKDATRIFMTATGDGIEAYLDEQNIGFKPYRMSGDYDQVRNLNFFWHDDQLPVLAEKIISSGQKGLFFIQSAKKAFSLYKQFEGQGMFICSVHNQTYSKFLDKEEISKFLQDEHFDCSILFTTTALDTGTNVKDKALTNIVIDLTEPVSVIQCIGRKRFTDDEDYLDVYIKARSNQQVGGLISELRKRADVVDQFIKNGAVSYNATNGRRNDDTGLIFDMPEVEEYQEPLFSKHVNKVKYAQICQSIKMYQAMLQLGEYGYVKYIAKLLEKTDYSITEEDMKRQNLTEYLNNINGVPLLTSHDREPLIRQLDIRHNSRLCKSYSVLSAWLESSHLPYRLLAYSTSRLVDGKKKNYRAWKIVCLE